MHTAYIILGGGNTCQVIKCSWYRCPVYSIRLYHSCIMVYLWKVGHAYNNTDSHMCDSLYN